MGLTRTEAYRILGLPDGSSQYVVLAHYRKLANRYHPDKNLHNREVALQKFQKVVEAYVRLQIEPDDCDQMKMKMILTELYAINEEILGGEYSFSEDSDDEMQGSSRSAVVPYASSASCFSQKGPYADVLQDFMLRSYMSGGRKTKPAVNMSTDKKRHASEREFEIATKHADELLQGEEQEKKKEEKRKQRNKKKKEAKKKKKDQKSSTDKTEEHSLSTEKKDLKLDSSNEEEKEEEEETKCEEGTDLEIRSVLSEIGNGLDMSSAFFSRVSSKINDKPIKQTTELSGGKKKTSTSNDYTKQNSGSSIEYSGSTDSSDKQCSSLLDDNNWSTISTTSSTSSMETSTTTKGISNGSSKGDVKERKEGRGEVKPKDKGDTKSSVMNKEDVKFVKGDKKFKEKEATTAATTTVTGKKEKTFYKEETKKSGAKGTASHPAVYKVPRRPPHYKSAPSLRQFQSNLPPRLAKLQQNKFTGKGNGRKRYNNNNDKDYDKESEMKESDRPEESTTVTNNDDSSRPHKQSEQYSSEAILKNGEDPDLEQSRKMAVLGNRAAKEGRFQDAVFHFTKAIEHYSSDIRYFGNRSFCYEYMKEYELALQDANKALKIDSTWPKGHFRKAKAFVGLKMYEEAEVSFNTAIYNDPNYTDAKEELKKLQIKRIMELGYDESVALQALTQCDYNIQEAIEALETKRDSNNSSRNSEIVWSGSSQEDEEYKWSDASDSKKVSKSPISSSVWVGNVNPATITEGMLFDIFKKCGKIKTVQILGTRFCAFVEFSKPSEAEFAVKKLQDCSIGECNLILKLRDGETSNKEIFNKRNGPVNGDECYYWRTTGCVFGGKCRYRHLSKNKGIDKTLYFN